MSDRAFKPTTRKIPIPRGGRIDSEKLASFVEQTTNDITNMGQFLTELSSRTDQEATVRASEHRDLKQRIEQLTGELEAIRKENASNLADVSFNISVYDSRNFQFLSTSSFANRVLVDTNFGEATVPINGVEPRFFRESISTNSIVPIEDLSVSVTGTFDAGDGNGLTNQEQGGTVISGEPLNAFNGNNNSRWLRKISFPLYNDTTEIMTEITVDVPAGSGGNSNVVYIVPSPAGEVDIVGVYTSPDLTDSFTIVDNFTTIEGAGPSRWFFPVRPVSRVKVRLRQRNWVEEDGQKVFYVGAQEIGLQLVEFDKTYSSSNALNENHTLVLKKTAPAGYEFNTLTRLTSSPLYSLEDSGLRHIHITASTSSDGSSPFWNSDTDLAPQDTSGFVLPSPSTVIYFFITLNYVSSSGGSSSPFPVGTTPIFNGLDFSAYLTEE